MDLKKNHAMRVRAEGNPRVPSSGLFGIINKAESINLTRKKEASISRSLNYEVGDSLRDAMLEAEYRKAQAITLTRQMRYI